MGTAGLTHRCHLGGGGSTGFAPEVNIHVKLPPVSEKKVFVFTEDVLAQVRQRLEFIYTFCSTPERYDATKAAVDECRKLLRLGVR